MAGNQTVEKTTANALAVLHAAGIEDVPVYKASLLFSCLAVLLGAGWIPTHSLHTQGQAKPMLRPAAPLCPEIHGESGLEGPQGGRIFPDAPFPAREGRGVIRQALIRPLSPTPGVSGSGA